MLELPKWCQPPEDFLGRDAVIQAAVEGVSEGPVCLVGASGVGTTATAGAVLLALQAQDTIDEAICIQVDESTRSAMLWIAIGTAIDAYRTGDEASVVKAMTARPRVAIFLDDADLAIEACRDLTRALPHCTWVLTARQAVIGQPVSVPSLTDSEISALCGQLPYLHEGLPLLARIPFASTDIEPWACAERLPRKWRTIAQFSMGYETDGPPPSSNLFSWTQGRARARRSLREAMGLQGPPTHQALEELVTTHMPWLHRVACDLICPANTDHLAWMRVAADTLDDPQLSALCAAAAARIHIRFFQSAEALSICEHALNANRLPVQGRGLLRWVEGDSLLLLGNEENAALAYRDAWEALQHVPSARLALARRCAERWAGRSRLDMARFWVASGRSELSQHPDTHSRADLLRIAGDLACRAGEVLWAQSLYDDAMTTLREYGHAPQVAALVHLGRIGLFLDKGEHQEAAQLIEIMEFQPLTNPEISGWLQYRKTELACRSQALDAAQTSLVLAKEGMRSAGSIRGLMCCARMAGDLAALSGDRAGAIDEWKIAKALCVRTADLHGLKSVLHRVLIVEKEGTPGPHIAEIQDQVDVLESALQVRAAKGKN